jgi:hypothetical protein
VEVNLTLADSYGEQGLSNNKPVINGNNTVQCFPLMTYLMALDIYYVNYFSLVIKDDGLQVLKQINFERIKIDIFTIEYALKLDNTSKNNENLKRIKDFLIGTGLYYQIKTVDSLHVVFKRKSM